MRRFLLSLSFFLILGSSTPAQNTYAVGSTGSTGGNVWRYRRQMFNVTETLDLHYGTAFNAVTNQVEPLYLDLYEPAGDPGTARAVVVVIHGGGFVNGDKQDYRDMSRYYASLGYVAVSVNYRLVDVPSQIALGPLYGASDTLAAVRWLRANAQLYRLVTSKIGLVGYSAGAISAVTAAYMDSPALTQSNNSNPGYSSEVSACVDLAGALLDVNDLEAGEAPLLIIHGKLDTTVPFQYAVDLSVRARAVGVFHEDHFLDNVGHSLLVCCGGLINSESTDFLYQHMIL